MEQLDFQILLTDNYYINPNSIHICFPIKIKKKTNQNLDRDTDLIRVNNFFTHFFKKISIPKYGRDKEFIPTFSPYEIYEYSDAMLKHVPADASKTIEKALLYSRKAVYYNDVNIERRIHNGDRITTKGINTTQIANTKRNYTKDLNVDERKRNLKTSSKLSTFIEYLYNILQILIRSISQQKSTIELNYILKRK